MRGPKPKAPELRQRRNKATTAATLHVPAEPIEKPETVKRAPPLPGGTMWHKQTRAWWKDVWASPMAKEFLQADRHALVRLAVLVNDFWMKPSAALAAEIRQQESRFGLTPIDRHRLQWRVVPEKSEPPPPPTAKEMREEGKDPREALRAVQ